MPSFGAYMLPTTYHQNRKNPLMSGDQHEITHQWFRVSHEILRGEWDPDVHGFWRHPPGSWVVDSLRSLAKPKWVGRFFQFTIPNLDGIYPKKNLFFFSRAMLAYGSVIIY